MREKISRETLDLLLIPSTATLTSVLATTWHHPLLYARRRAPTPQYEDGRSRIHA